MPYVDVGHSGFYVAFIDLTCKLNPMHSGATERAPGMKPRTPAVRAQARNDTNSVENGISDLFLYFKKNKASQG